MLRSLKLLSIFSFFNVNYLYLKYFLLLYHPIIPTIDCIITRKKVTIDINITKLNLSLNIWELPSSIIILTKNPKYHHGAIKKISNKIPIKLYFRQFFDNHMCCWLFLLFINIRINIINSTSWIMKYPFRINNIITSFLKFIASSSPITIWISSLLYIIIYINNLFKKY